MATNDAASSHPLSTTPTIPIAQLNPSLPDLPHRAVLGVVTVVWPYNSAQQCISFILAEPQFRLRRTKGQVRVKFTGPSARGVRACGLAGSDTVRLGLEGAEWERDDGDGQLPGANVEWQVRFTDRAVLLVTPGDGGSDVTKVVEIDHPVLPEFETELAHDDVVAHGMTPNNNKNAHSDLRMTDTGATPISALAFASLQRSFEDDEFASPAFLKRSRASYGSLFEGGLDIFEDDGGVKGKGRKRSRFGRDSGAWRYSSQSPSPEPEAEQDLDPEEEEEEKVGAVASTPTRKGYTLRGNDEPVDATSTPRTTVDEGCQTMELDVASPARTPQVQVAETEVIDRSGQDNATARATTHATPQQQSPEVLPEASSGTIPPPADDHHTESIDDIQPIQVPAIQRPIAPEPEPYAPLLGQSPGPFSHSEHAFKNPFVDAGDIESVRFGFGHPGPAAAALDNHLPTPVPAAETENVDAQMEREYEPFDQTAADDMIDPALDHSDYPPPPLHFDEEEVEEEEEEEEEEEDLEEDAEMSAQDPFGGPASGFHPAYSSPYPPEILVSQAPSLPFSGMTSSSAGPFAPQPHDQRSLVGTTRASSRENGSSADSAFVIDDDSDSDGEAVGGDEEIEEELEVEEDADEEEEEEEEEVDDDDDDGEEDDESGNVSTSAITPQPLLDPDAIDQPSAAPSRDYSEVRHDYDRADSDVNAENSFHPEPGYEENDEDDSHDNDLREHELEPEFDQGEGEKWDEEEELEEELEQIEEDGEYDSLDEEMGAEMGAEMGGNAPPVMQQQLLQVQVPSQNAAPMVIDLLSSDEESGGEEAAEDGNETDQRGSTGPHGAVMNSTRGTPLSFDARAPSYDPEEEVADDVSEDDEDEMEYDRDPDAFQSQDEDENEDEDEDEEEIGEGQRDPARQLREAIDDYTRRSAKDDLRLEDGPSSMSNQDLVPEAVNPRDDQPDTSVSRSPQRLQEPEAPENSLMDAEAFSPVKPSSSFATQDQDLPAQPTSRSTGHDDERMQDAHDDDVSSDRIPTQVPWSQTVETVTSVTELTSMDANEDVDDDAGGASKTVEMGETDLQDGPANEIQPQMDVDSVAVGEELVAEEQVSRTSVIVSAAVSMEESAVEIPPLEVDDPIAMESGEILIQEETKVTASEEVVEETEEDAPEPQSDIDSDEDESVMSAEPGDDVHSQRAFSPIPDDSSSSDEGGDPSELDLDDALQAELMEEYTRLTGVEIEVALVACSQQARDEAEALLQDGDDTNETADKPVSMASPSPAPLSQADPTPTKAREERVESSPSTQGKSRRGRSGRRKSVTIDDADEFDPSVQLAREIFAPKHSKSRHGTTPEPSGPVTRSRSSRLSMSPAPSEHPDTSANLARASLHLPAAKESHPAPVPGSPVSATKIDEEAPSTTRTTNEDPASLTAAKLHLVRHLEHSLPDYTPLRSLRACLKSSQHSPVDVLAIAMMTPPEPQRAKGGPREYMMSFTVTDHTLAPHAVAEVFLYRPHRDTLPHVQAGDVVLLRAFQVLAVKGKGFGLRSTEGSAWAVFRDPREPAQVRGPPVEVGGKESVGVGLMADWFGLVDGKARAELEDANGRIVKAGEAGK